MTKKRKTLKSATLATSERSGNNKTNYRYFNGKKPLSPTKNYAIRNN